MIEFSDAIELGSTMIEEDPSYFYDLHSGAGCVHGAACAAIGKLGKVSYSVSGLFFPICGLLLSRKECSILAAGSAVEFTSYFRGRPRVTLGKVVSYVHGWGGVPRLELAQRVREIEELHPEIPGFNPMDHPVQVTVLGSFKW